MNDNTIRVYKNINLNEFTDLDLDWSRKQNKRFSKIHSISSYLAMFSPSIPEYFIKKYTKKNDVIMDNFSGRGTTALVSRELNREFIGSDLNPYAYVLSRFKISVVSFEKTLNRIDELENKFNIVKSDIKIFSDKYKELKYFYHNNVLKQLIFLRDEIGSKWLHIDEIDNSIISIALGLMHGQQRKDGTTMYFSLNMPNSISMSPKYVMNYAKKIT